MSTTFTPRVITGELVDVISPFPPVYLDRLAKWAYQYRSMITVDSGPQTPDEMKEFMANAVASQISYGVVDKTNIIGLPDPQGPIVIGAFIIECGMPSNAYFHVVSQRRAWGKGLMDEGGHLVIQDMFEQYPELNRLSGYMTASNKAIQSFAKRQGFNRDGYFVDMLTIKGKPADVVHMGLTRAEFMASKGAEPLEE
jgi:RimJ/RimL family protein N-acetyltransferase